MKFTIDSSVFIANFMTADPNHASAVQFFHSIDGQGNKVVLPITIPLEVINVMSRKTATVSEWAVDILKKIFFQSDTIEIRELHLDFVQPFSEKCKVLNLKTADAIITLSALEEGSTLVSFDRELLRKAKKLVSAKSPQEAIPKT